MEKNYFDLTITRDSQIIQLTEQEAETIAKTVLHKERMETCALMARAYLESLGIFDTNDAQQIERFMGQVMPESEQDRLASLYEARMDDYTAPYERWSFILAEQMLYGNGLLRKTMRRIIYDHASVEIRTKILNSKICNLSGKSNLDAVLKDLSTSTLLTVWKNFRFILQV